MLSQEVPSNGIDSAAKKVKQWLAPQGLLTLRGCERNFLDFSRPEGQTGLTLSRGLDIPAVMSGLLRGAPECYCSCRRQARAMQSKQEAPQPARAIPEKTTR